nr:MAG TPA: hypothetical protein [Caudoviricetes sp.]
MTGGCSRYYQYRATVIIHHFGGRLCLYYIMFASH